MVVKIGENIKTLRKEHGVTQERLGEYLGLSPQAVSRWESEVCYPDLELIPALAAFFGVSSDRLLGVDTSENEQREAVAKASALMTEGRQEEALAAARQGLALYPGNHALAALLASLLFMKAAGKGNAEELLAEPIALCRRILRDCSGGNDDSDIIRLSVRQLLIRLLVQAKKHAEAFGLAMVMPSVIMSREVLMPASVTGEERERELAAALPMVIVMLNSSMVHPVRHEGKAPPLLASTTEDCRQDLAVWDAAYAWKNREAGEKAKQSNWVYLALCQRKAKAILEEYPGDEKAETEAALYFAKAVSCLPFVDGPDAPLTNLPARAAAVAADPLAAAEEGNYAGKSSAYVLLHAYVENGYLAALAGEPVFDEALEKLRVYAAGSLEK